MKNKKYYIRMDDGHISFEGFYTAKEILEFDEFNNISVKEIIDFGIDDGLSDSEIERMIARNIFNKDKRNYDFVLYRMEKFLKEIELKKSERRFKK